MLNFIFLKSLTLPPLERYFTQPVCEITLIQRCLLSQHLYSIHLADQNEDCTMQLVDHIRVSTGIANSLQQSGHSNKSKTSLCSFFFIIHYHTFSLPGTSSISCTSRDVFM